MTILATTAETRNPRITFRLTSRPENQRLDRELDDLADVIAGERFASSAFAAEVIRELANRARQLEAETVEEFKARDHAQKQEVLTIVPYKDELGQFDLWDVRDGNGSLVHSGIDPMLAAMWIEERKSA